MIEYINILSNDYPVRISHRAIKKWRQDTKRDISSLGSEPGDFEALLLEGLRVGAKLEKKLCKLTIDDIDEWLDEDMVGNMEILTNMISVHFQDSEPGEALTIRQVYDWLKTDSANYEQIMQLLENGLPEEFPDLSKND